MFIMAAGVIDNTLDFKLEESETVGGVYTDVAGKSITQFADTDDQKIAVIFVKYSEMTATKPFVRASVDSGAGTTSLISVIGIGIDPVSELVVDADLASVKEIVGGSIYRGSKCFFITDDPVPEPEGPTGIPLDPATLTYSVNFAAGVNLDSWEGPVSLPGERVGMHHNVSAIAGPGPTEETLTAYVVLNEDETQVLHMEAFPDDGVPVSVEGDGPVFEMLLPLDKILTTGETN